MKGWSIASLAAQTSRSLSSKSSGSALRTRSKASEALPATRGDPGGAVQPASQSGGGGDDWVAVRDQHTHEVYYWNRATSEFS